MKEGTTGASCVENVLGGGSGEVDSVVEPGQRLAGAATTTSPPWASTPSRCTSSWTVGMGQPDHRQLVHARATGHAVHLVGDAEQAGNVVGVRTAGHAAGDRELSNVDCR